MRNNKPALFLFLILFINSSLQAQIVINEVCSKNENSFIDKSGNTPDWIELYNTSDSIVNLKGFSISDDPLFPFKWVFNEFQFHPNSFLLVCASGEDLNTENLRDENLSNLSNKYWTWADIQAEKPGRSTIEPLDFVDFQGEIDGKTAYSAKMFIADNTIDGNIDWHASILTVHIESWDTYFDYSKYNKLIIKATITEGRDVTVRLVQKDLEDWLGYGYTITGNGIEDYAYEIPLNNELASENLKELISVKYEARLPEGYTDITITDHIWVKDSGYIHTNFKLSSSGETLQLFDNTGKVVDILSIPEMSTDFSYGKAQDGGSTESLFPSPTPLQSNDTAKQFTGYCEKSILFSKEAGFYDGSIDVNVTGASEIRYTVDGSSPTFDSPLLESPYTIDSTLVFKATCFDDNSYPIKVYTNTYIINEPTTLPVFSISTEPKHFFDYNTGIYVDGPNWTEDKPHYGANYWEDWERPIYLEFFDNEGNIVLEQGAETEIFGGWSRTSPLKSLKLKAKEEYGIGRFHYKFFAHKSNDSFKQLVLRNSGNDCNRMHFHDAINHESARSSCNVDLQGFQPAVVYINGQYWGILNIREKINHYYIEDNHGTKADTVELFESYGDHIGEGNFNINDIYEKIRNSNTATDSDYNKVAQHFDIENMIDFFAINTFISNWDWPHNNLKLWYSPHTKKIRYIMYDTDISLGKFNLQDVQFNQIQRLIEANDIGPNAEIFSKFMQNQSFREAFINRSADLMNTAFSNDKMTNIIDSIQTILQPEIEKHYRRWDESINRWYDYIDFTKEFINDRHPIAREQLKVQFNLNKEINLALDVLPKGAGHIKINSITPQSLPWTGIYFDGVPVTITAVPSSGFSFEKWQFVGEVIDATDQHFTQNITKSTSITAHFTGESEPLQLIVSEINYNSLDTENAGDWFELFNAGESDVNLSGWKIKDENDYNYFSFPDNTVIKSQSYMVFASDFALFTEQFPINPTVVPFRLDNKGDKIRLVDAFNTEQYVLRYNDKSPWPTEADGQGYTLEFKTENSDPNNALNWFVGCLGGSPGIAFDQECSPITTIKETPKKKTSSKNLLIYPNPATDFISVIYNENTIKSIEITDLLGKVVYKSELTGKPISISNFNSGVYTVTIYTDSETLSERLLKQN